MAASAAAGSACLSKFHPVKNVVENVEAIGLRRAQRQAGLDLAKDAVVAHYLPSTSLKQGRLVRCHLALAPARLRRRVGGHVFAVYRLRFNRLGNRQIGNRRL